QLPGSSGRTTTVEYFHPNVRAFDARGEAVGMLCIGSVVLSGEVGEKGRSMFVTSTPKSKRFPSLGAGIYLINIFCSAFPSILPSCKASYKLGHFLWKRGDSDNSGNDCACVSVMRASTMSNKASFALRKQM